MPLTVVGVDPGSVLTGLAVVKGGVVIATKAFRPDQVLEGLAWIDHRHPTRVVVEDYQGSGPRSRDSQITTELIGAYLWGCRLNGYPAEKVPPQRRLAYVEQAQLHAHQKDEVSALAHALSAYERINRG